MWSSFNFSVPETKFIYYVGSQKKDGISLGGWTVHDPSGLLLVGSRVVTKQEDLFDWNQDGPAPRALISSH